MSKSLDDQAANPTQFNIEAISRLEREALHLQTAAERASDLIVRFVGSTRFLLLQVFLVAAWSTVNLHLIPSLRPFDPFPFGVLALVVSFDSVCLTIFVLISQNRMSRQAEKRSHLDLQVSMLSGQELTTVLEMLQKLCQHAGVDVKSTRQQVEGFSKTTDVHKLSTDLEEQLPER